MSSVESMGAAHRALAERAWDSNRTRAAELTVLVDDWRRSGRWTPDQRERARSVAHSLRGSAATFGHEHASDVAEQLEELLASAPHEARLDTVVDLVERIDEALAQEPELDF